MYKRSKLFFRKILQRDLLDHFGMSLRFFRYCTRTPDATRYNLMLVAACLGLLFMILRFLPLVGFVILVVSVLFLYKSNPRGIDMPLADFRRLKTREILQREDFDRYFDFLEAFANSRSRLTFSILVFLAIYVGSLIHSRIMLFLVQHEGVSKWAPEIPIVVNAMEYVLTEVIQRGFTTADWQALASLCTPSKTGVAFAGYILCYLLIVTSLSFVASLVTYFINLKKEVTRSLIRSLARTSPEEAQQGSGTRQ